MRLSLLVSAVEHFATQAYGLPITMKQGHLNPKKN
jgi:hypothetical protein